MTIYASSNHSENPFLFEYMMLGAGLVTLHNTKGVGWERERWMDGCRREVSRPYIQTHVERYWSYLRVVQIHAIDSQSLLHGINSTHLSLRSCLFRLFFHIPALFSEFCETSQGFVSGQASFHQSPGLVHLHWSSRSRGVRLDNGLVRSMMTRADLLLSVCLSIACLLTCRMHWPGLAVNDEAWLRDPCHVACIPS